MGLFPFQQETLLFPHSAQRAEALLYAKIAEITEPGEEIIRLDKVPEFNGIVNNGRFSISLRVKRGHTFLPLLNGSIEQVAAGCRINCRYELFFSTKLFLGFWTVLTLSMALFFTFGNAQPTHAIFTYTMAAGNYLIASANFNLQCKRSRRIFHLVFEE